MLHVRVYSESHELNFPNEKETKFVSLGYTRYINTILINHWKILQYIYILMHRLLNITITFCIFYVVFLAWEAICIDARTENNTKIKFNILTSVMHPNIFQRVHANPFYINSFEKIKNKCFTFTYVMFFFFTHEFRKPRRSFIIIFLSLLL